MGISIHKTELANCGSSDEPGNLQCLDFGTISQVKNLVAGNVSITEENVVNMGSILFFVLSTAWNTQEYRFSLTRILPYKGIIADSVLIQETMGKWKPVFSHSLSSDVFDENICIHLHCINICRSHLPLLCIDL